MISISVASSQKKYHTLQAKYNGNTGDIRYRYGKADQKTSCRVSLLLLHPPTLLKMASRRKKIQLVDKANKYCAMDPVKLPNEHPTMLDHIFDSSMMGIVSERELHKTCFLKSAIIME
jgi:hypothetical protein